MKKGYSVALVGALIAGLGLIQPGVASAATACNSPMPIANMTISGSVKVPPGGTCTLDHTTVTGSIQTGGVLKLSNGSTVNGSLTEQDGVLTIDHSTVRGSVAVLNGTINTTGATIGGSVKVTDTTNASMNDICGGSIGGSVTVSGVTDLNATSGGWVRLLGAGGTAPNPCAEALKIIGAVTFSGNNVFVRISKATVRGAVKLTNNSSASYDPPSPESAVVTENTISGSLSCLGNSPAPIGFGNVAVGGKTGDCMGF